MINSENNLQQTVHLTIIKYIIYYKPIHLITINDR